MKKLIVTTLLVLSMLFPKPASALVIQGGFIRIDSSKVVVISGVIDPDMTGSVALQLQATANLPGPRIVIIRSPGGQVEEGIKIIKLLQKERSQTHQKLICVAVQGAHSMAFNIMTQCDVRYATAGTQMIAHKIAIGGVGEDIRLTAKNMRKMADELEKLDREWAEANARALHISSNEYDRYADKDYRWSVTELLARNYLNAIVSIR